MLLSRPEPVVILRTDASPTIGGGHAMRCLTLADALARRGARCVFVMVEITAAMHCAINHAGHRIAIIDCGDERESDLTDASASNQQNQAAATAAIAASEDATHLVVDHYRLDRTFAAHPGLVCLRTLAIDDLADRPLACDVLVDQTVGRNPDAYRHLAPGATLLTGARYALLRPQFAARRPAALLRRMQPRAAGRLLVSMGSTDLDGITALVLAAVQDSGYRGAVDVVLGHDAPSRAAVEAIARDDPRFVLHADVTDMATLMVAADLAIGAAGTTTWERCALGLPTLTLVLADNQCLVAREIAAAGAGIVSDLDCLAADLTLVENADALATMSAAAFALVDGSGTERVADAFLASTTTRDVAMPVTLRPATVADSERLWLWRNDPVTRNRSQSRAPIRRADHEHWFTTTLASCACRIWIAERDGRAVASTRIDRTGDDGVVSIMVAPDAQGAGIGSRVLAATCACWDRDALGAAPAARLRAVIHNDNDASIRIFRRCGFVPETDTAVSPDGFRTYVRDTYSDLESMTR